jgi:outer membrane protein assembly factor BamB
MMPSNRSLPSALLLVATLVGPAFAAEPAPLPGTTLMQRRFLDVEPIRRDPTMRWKVRSVAGAAKEEWTNCLVQDGVMYGTARGVLHAIDVDKGELLWTRQGPGGHPAIQGDTVYAAGSNRFYAVDRKTGDSKWETPTSPMLCGWSQSYGFMKPATVIADGIAYFGSKSSSTNDCHYHAVDLATGRMLWKEKPGNEPWTARPIVAAGRLYGSCHFDPIAAEEPGVWRRPKRGSGLVALDLKTGKRAWFRPDKSTIANPVYDAGTLYVGLSNAVEALDAETGESLWTADVDIHTVSKTHPAGGNVTGLALHDGVLLAGGAGPTLVAIDVATRRELWRFRAPEIVEILNPIICRDVVIVSTCGTVGGDDFATGRNSPIIGLDLKTGAKLWQCTVPGTDCVVDGERKAWNSYVCGWAYPAGDKLFAFSFTGCFYCFETPPR